jgi:hypothetical protein
MQDSPRIRADATVQEGGTIQFRCDANVHELLLVVPGVGTRRVRVAGGRAEFTLPPQVRGGSTILAADGVLPNPSSISISVVGGSSR